MCNDAIGSLMVSNSTVVGYLDAPANFTFNFVTNVVPILPPLAQTFWP